MKIGVAFVERIEKPSKRIMFLLITEMKRGDSCTRPAAPQINTWQNWNLALEVWGVRVVVCVCVCVCVCFSAGLMLGAESGKGECVFKIC